MRFPPIRSVLILNGPNVGRRYPDHESQCRRWAEALGLGIESFSSNHEGDLIERLQQAPGGFDGVVINPGPLSLTSYALHDAISASGLPAVEVQVADVKPTEEWRRRSVLEPACVLGIWGRGISGYDWALRHLVYGSSMEWEEIAYGPHPDQVGDLRLPSRAGGHPVIVLLHGGFWEDQWRRDLMDGLAVSLTEAGYATWNLEYRRVGPGGGWPSTLLDVAAGIDHLSELEGLDLGQVTILGHSAGGQLALWGGARARLDDGAPGGSPAVLPQRVVAMAAVSDLEDAERTGVGNGAVSAFLRGAADHGDKYRLASPIELLPLGVSQLVVHGDRDAWVPVEMSRRYVERAREVGDLVSYLELAGGDHLSLIDPRSATWRRVRDHLR